MGDIAEMHVAAIEAGLDPNEMDGADWAEFLEGEDDPLTLEEVVDLIGTEARMIGSWIDDLAELNGAPGRPEAIAKQFPDFSEEQARALVEAVQKLSAATIKSQDAREGGYQNG